MKTNFPHCLNYTLAMEGGYVNNPKDPGGATMKGVTLKVYQHWKKNNNLTANDLKHITNDEISAIYHDNYWVPVMGDELIPGMDLMVFDMAVNAGPERAVMILQSAIGTKVDGQMGPITLGKMATIGAVNLINAYSKRCADFYRSLSTFSTFGRGWMNRVNARQAAALSLASHIVADIHPPEPVAKRVKQMDHSAFFEGVKPLV